MPRRSHLRKVRYTLASSPNSFGSWFHCVHAGVNWQPVRIRKMIPFSARRWSTRGLPVLAGGSQTVKTLLTASHNAWGTCQIVSKTDETIASMMPSSAVSQPVLR